VLDRAVAPALVLVGDAGAAVAVGDGWETGDSADVTVPMVAVSVGEATELSFDDCCGASALQPARTTSSASPTAARRFMNVPTAMPCKVVAFSPGHEPLSLDTDR
jgi:hypothetical protein